jgi:RNA polymerase sigma factor (sigma-70 family)
LKATADKLGFMAALEAAHGRQLRRFLAARMRGAASADVPDVIQEIFLRLLRIKDHEAIRNPQAYLFTVASHVVHQYNLQRAARPEQMMSPALEPTLEDKAAPDPAEELDFQQRLEELGRALEKLSPRAHAALVMYRCEGLTLVEIGARLGVSHVMARKYLARAIAFCDQYLEETE